MMARLGDVFPVIRNGVSIKQNEGASGFPITRIETISNREIDRTKFGYANVYDIDKYKEYILRDGDILMSHINSEKHLGKVAMYRAQGNEKIIHGMNLLLLRVDPQKLLPAYAEYFFNSKSFLRQLPNITKKSVNQSSFSVSSLKELKIDLYDLNYQEYVIQRLNQTSQLIALRKQQLAKLDELVKARFVEMFGNIEQMVPLSYYIAALNAGKSLAGEEECPNKVLKTGAASYDYFDPTQVKDLPLDYEPLEDHRINTGNVIISRMNTMELVGATAYIWEAPERTYLPDRLWKAEIKETANPVFVWQVLIQSSTKESIRRIASGTSGSMKNISKPGLLSIRVKKVDLSAQEQFAAFVTQIDKSKLTIQQSLAKMEMLKQALIQKYFG